MAGVSQGSKFIPRVTNRLNLVKSLKKKQKHGRLIIAVEKRPTKGPLTALASLCAVYGPTLSQACNEEKLSKSKVGQNYN